MIREKHSNEQLPNEHSLNYKCRNTYVTQVFEKALGFHAPICFGLFFV